MIPMLSIHWQWFARCFDFGFFILIVIVHTPVAHSHNAPYLPPKILHNLCFSFLLGITAVPREIENNAYAKFWGANKVHCGRCASGV